MKVLTKGIYCSVFSDLVVEVHSVLKFNPETVKVKMTIYTNKGHLVSRAKWYKLDEDRIDHWEKMNYLAFIK